MLSHLLTHFQTELLIKESAGWAAIFVILGLAAVLSQYHKDKLSKFVPGIVLHLLKAAPALFLAGLSWNFEGPRLLTIAFLLCAAGDIFLDLKASWGFAVGAVAFAAALFCLAALYLGHQSAGYPIWRLCLTNVFIAAFVLRWVIPNLKGPVGKLEVVYFLILIGSNIIASLTIVPIFLGSSLWLMSDLSIGIGENAAKGRKDDVAKVKVTTLDTLGLYDVGLYFIAIGFLNS